MPRAPFLTPNRILNKIKRLRAQGQAPNSYQIVWPLQQHDAERAEAGYAELAHMVIHGAITINPADGGYEVPDHRPQPLQPDPTRPI